MVEAANRLHDALKRSTTLIDCAITLIRLARFSATCAVKEQIRARGFRPSRFTVQDILTAANEFLSEHPELIDQAAERVRSSPRLRPLGEREARERARRKYHNFHTTTEALRIRAFGCADIRSTSQMIIGYARVSTDGQSVEAQQAALNAAGAGWVFSEKVSGVVTDRKALGKSIASLTKGDVLLVTRLDIEVVNRQADG